MKIELRKMKGNERLSPWQGIVVREEMQGIDFIELRKGAAAKV